MPGGRPTNYNKEITAELCSRIAVGNSLRSVCKADDMPAIATVYKWFMAHPEFVEHYARAKQDSGDSDADKIEEIAEKVLEGDYDPHQGKVAIDAFKWTASKKIPKKYGDRITNEHTGTIGLTHMTEDQLDQKLQELLDDDQNSEQ